MVPIQVEVWIWYAVVMLVVFARFTSRYLNLGGIQKFHIEDWCMCVVAILYTIEVNLIIKAAFTPSNLIAPGDFEGLTPENIQLRIFGSKLTIALEMIYCATIWGCKGCLLLCYSNLTKGLKQHFLCKVVAIYAFSGYLLMVILYFSVWCQPFYEYWSVPAANPQCSTYLHHLITNLVFNVSSDLMMLFIPLPLLLRTQLPLQKKIVVCFVFSLGIFCIMSAVLNKFYSFTRPYGSEWVFWYIREVSTAVIVANVPHCWSLIRRVFRLRSFVNNTEQPSGQSRANRRAGASPTIGGTGGSKHNSMHAFPATAAFANRRWMEDAHSLPSDTEGEEMEAREMTMVNVKGKMGDVSKHDSHDVPLGFWDAEFVKFSAAEDERNKMNSEDLAEDESGSHGVHPVSRQELVVETSNV